MRSLVTLSLSVIAAMVVAACSGDQGAPTAPTTTPSFKLLSPDKQYQFSFSCSANVKTGTDGSFSDMNIYHSKKPDVGNATPLTLYCGDSPVVGDVYSFDYGIELFDATSGSRVPVTCQTQKNGVSYTIDKPGTFTCAYQTWSATLTVSEVSP